MSGDQFLRLQWPRAPLPSYAAALPTAEVRLAPMGRDCSPRARSGKSEVQAQKSIRMAEE